MKIAIGCSMRFRDLARKVVADMTALGLEPLLPNLEYSDENTDKADTPEEKKRLALEHYAAIDAADAVYLITPDGYMGTSCKLELGYAIAKGKPVYFSEPTQDMALDCYVKGYVPVSELSVFVKH